MAKVRIESRLEEKQTTEMLLHTPHPIPLRDDIVPFYEIPRARSRRKKGMKPTFKSLILWHLAALCYQLCQTLCNGDATFQNNILVDLSYEFNEETIYWVTAKPLDMNVISNGTSQRGFWYQMEEISASTHGGTHLDAPCHFVRGKWCVSDIPLEHLVTNAVMVDISEHVQSDPNVHLTKDHLMSWEKIHGRIPDGSLLLIRTGWGRFWPNKLEYMGTNEKDVSRLKFPTVSPEAAQWIVDNKRQIVGLGIDSLSVDIAGSAEPKVHQILEERNIYQIENVNNELRLLPPTGTIVYVLPMKLKNASGAPCRVLATVDKSHQKSGECSLHCSNASVVSIVLYCVYIVYKNYVR